MPPGYTILIRFLRSSSNYLRLLPLGPPRGGGPGAVAKRHAGHSFLGEVEARAYLGTLPARLRRSIRRCLGSSSWRGHQLLSPRWTAPTASATARRSTGSRACPREGGGPAPAKAGDGMLPSDFFRRNVVLSFQENAIGIRLRDVIGPDNMI